MKKNLTQVSTLPTDTPFDTTTGFVHTTIGTETETYVFQTPLETSTQFFETTGTETETMLRSEASAGKGVSGLRTMLRLGATAGKDPPFETTTEFVETTGTETETTTQFVNLSENYDYESQDNSSYTTETIKIPNSKVIYF